MILRALAAALIFAPLVVAYTLWGMPAALWAILWAAGVALVMERLDPPNR